MLPPSLKLGGGGGGGGKVSGGKVSGGKMSGGKVSHFVTAKLLTLQQMFQIAGLMRYHLPPRDTNHERLSKSSFGRYYYSFTINSFG